MLSLANWDTFNHDGFFAQPEDEPIFANSADDPIVTLPPDWEPPTHEEMSPLLTEDQPATRPWHTLPQDVWDEVWDKTADYREYIVIASLDTGVNPHELLPKPLDMWSNIPGQSPFDGNFHGTHTLSTAIGLNGFGVCPGAQSVVVKVLSNGGSGSSSGIAKAHRQCADWKDSEGNTIDVTINSYGGGSKYQPTIDNALYGFRKGVFGFFAAGNSGPRERTEGWPAADPNLPSIGAHDSQRRPANFSSRGNVTVSAPGVNIVGASHRSRTARVSASGTSMATPFFAGLWGLLTALRRASGLPQWRDNKPVFDICKAYATDVYKPGVDSATGFGIIKYDELISDMAKFGKDLFIKKL